MGKLRGKLLFLRGKFLEYINAHDIWLSRCPLRGGAHRHVCPAYAQYSAQYAQVACVSLRVGALGEENNGQPDPANESSSGGYRTGNHAFRGHASSTTSADCNTGSHNRSDTGTSRSSQHLWRSRLRVPKQSEVASTEEGRRSPSRNDSEASTCSRHHGQHPC